MSSRVFILILLVLQTQIVCAEMRFEYEIRFLKDVSIVDAKILLGEVAEITQKSRLGHTKFEKEAGKNTELAKLSELILAEAPRVGYRKIIRVSDIEPRIDSIGNGLRNRITWLGKQVISVSTSSQMIEKVRVIDSARSLLKRSLIARYKNIKINPVGKYQDLYVPVGKIEIDAHLPNESAVKNRMNVWVDIAVNGNQYQTVPVWLSVQAMENVLVAKRNLLRGDLLYREDFMVMESDVAKLNGQPLSEFFELNGNRLKSAVNAMDVLIKDKIETVPHVIKGQRVRVTANVGDINIETFAISMEDGFVGDTIKVKKSDSGAQYTAMITGKKRVTVDGEN